MSRLSRDPYWRRASLRRRLAELEGAVGGLLVSFDLVDGTTYRYRSDEGLKRAFKNWSDRLHAKGNGEPDPGAHPLVEALKRAKPGELTRLIEDEGEPSLLQLFVKDDAGFQERR